MYKREGTTIDAIVCRYLAYFTYHGPITLVLDFDEVVGTDE